MLRQPKAASPGAPSRRCSARRFSPFLLFLLVPSAFAQQPTQGAPQSAARGLVEEIVVTAQKREENINEVGMSIQAASGDKLYELGIQDTSELYKVVTGFNSNVTYYGTAIYTIRGVGFQDTALASGPTVSVYLDEAPLPFSAMTQGLTLDLQRVEVLKGPQGTLFGQNSTGGAVNYIANKPTDELEAGFDASYGRFNTSDVTGFVSGPLTDTLSYRVAARTIQSDEWQENYAKNDNLPPDPYWVKAGQTYTVDDESGKQDFWSYRAALEWAPGERFAAILTGSGFSDNGDSQRPQLFGFAPLHPETGLNPLVADYPVSPDNNRDASWGPCVNVSGGTPSNVTGDTDADGNPENLSNRLYDHCQPAKKNNDYWSAILRMDYELTDDLTLTSLTSYGKFSRDQRLESDGTLYQDYESYQSGHLKAFFQEVRVAGSVLGQGSWVAGANYEDTSTWDSFMQTYGISTAVPTAGIPLGPTNPNNKQSTETWAVFGNVEYPMFENWRFHAGLRYTNQQRDYRGCGSDGGDGTWSSISYIIQAFVLGSTNPLLAGPGECASTGPPPDYQPETQGFEDNLDQDNWSWRVAADWDFAETMMAYASISEGYKSGSFPTVASAAFTQLFPAKQEDLIAYEIGTKMGLFDQTLQANAAVFYYDYSDKQILGAINDPVFGSLPALVNVPDSEVIGGELILEWYPIEGLRLAPSVSYAKSEIKGDFTNFDPFFSPVDNPFPKDFSGEPFPNAPEWQANFDAQYNWNLDNGWLLFVGGHVNYQSSTKGFFYDRCEDPSVPCTKTDYPGLVGNSDLVIDSRTLIDLRGGVEVGAWRVWAWGRNVTDEYYWNQTQHVNDVLLRFTGMPRTYGLAVSYRYE